MINFITLCCLFTMVTFPSIINIFAYPISKKLSLHISNYIVKTLAPRLFAILSCYKHFKFLGYKDKFDKLPKQFMIISNHQSLLDIPCFMNYLRKFDLRFVAKDELGRHIPLVSEMLRSQEHCLLPRHSSPAKTMKILEDFGSRVCERNQIPVLFPEGTRTRDGNVGKFYSAGFRKLSDATKLPIVLCALDGGWEIGHLDTIMRKLKYGNYRIKIMKIYDAPKTKEEQANILEEAQVIIQKQLDEWRKK